jgi:hypothetical protein
VAVPDATPAEPLREARESGVVLASSSRPDAPPASLAELAAAVFAGAPVDDDDDAVVVEEHEPLDAVGIILEGIESVDATAPLAAAPASATANANANASANAPATPDAPANASPEAKLEAAAAVDPFHLFVTALVDVALAVASPAAASGVVPLLDGTAPETLTPEARDLLLAARVLVETEGGLRASDTFESARVAWRDILRGTGDDFAACGGAIVARATTSPRAAEPCSTTGRPISSLASRAAPSRHPP